MANNLIDSKSPYLRQHAFNPINWYPWHKQALDKASKENKLLFISIGYSTCHWCHVMAKESFENEEIARLLNEEFISIKVDRDERPDIDNIYMSACVAMNGQGGWPLTVLALPSQKPFFIATYLPFKTTQGRIGLFELLTKVIEEWRKGGENFIEYGNELTDFLRQQNNIQQQAPLKEKELFDKAFSEYEKGFDKLYGGFNKSAPKFPMPHSLMFLMRYHYYENNAKALKMVERTLESMYKGGIYDHLGGGFSRYSTDRLWLIPHFEKMLYDNALLAMAYTEAYQITGKELYMRVAENTLEFTIRELNSTSGGFWTALDADTEGEEGLFYALEEEEIIKILGEEDANIFNKHFNVTSQGNFDGKNILNVIGNREIEPDEKLVTLIQAMYHYRKKRHNLHIDDKILVSMNSLMVCAFIKAYKAMDRQAYLILAEKTMEFIEDNLIDDDSNIYASYREGRSDILGGLDDYAFYCMALVDMYEATFNPKYLKRAILLVNKTVENFADSENGGFFMNDKRIESLIYRPKDHFDSAIPSGNSVMSYVLNKIYKLTRKEELRELAENHNRYIETVATKYPNQLSFALIALMQRYYPSREIIAVAEDWGDIDSLKEEQKEFMPDTTYIVKFTSQTDSSDYSDFLWEYNLQNNTTTYYICDSYGCKVQNKL